MGVLNSAAHWEPQAKHSTHEDRNHAIDIEEVRDQRLVDVHGRIAVNWASAKAGRGFATVQGHERRDHGQSRSDD